jgi:hypothetical protein
MATTFKKIIQETEFTFYKTQVLDEIVYFVLYNQGKSRELLRIGKDALGQWVMPTDLPYFLLQSKQQFIRAVEENEKS